MGNDTPLAVLSDRQPLLYSLLQAAVRAGHEPADRPDPRGGRDERAVARRLRAQPARRDAGARAPARDRQPDPARRRARAAAPGRVRRLHARTRSTSRGRSPRAPAALERGARAHLRRGRRRARRRARTSSILSDRAVGPERVADARRCSRRRRVHHHLVRAGHAPAGRASSSSRASRAACRASPC